MTFDGEAAASWSRCLHLPFRGKWGLQLIAAVKFNAQDTLLILPGVSGRLSWVRLSRAGDRGGFWELRLDESLPPLPSEQRRELQGRLCWTRSNLAFLLDQDQIQWSPAEVCSFIKMETDTISEISINANLLGTQTGLQLGNAWHGGGEVQANVSNRITWDAVGGGDAP